MKFPRYRPEYNAWHNGSVIMLYGCFAFIGVSLAVCALIVYVIAMENWSKV